ncbi:MAG: tyrosine-protein phosphatase [Gordonia sp. (in: high G+C Gram-positive bacteria)]|uniref:tyrosine-protein phosphatase n=1 Tax=Gordonia sp. (in: high G+C Gram-positive bacteria) TaxID=84139 RepID=UPI0039E534B2
MPANDAAGAPSPFPSLANFRDLGHWVGDGERVVRPATLYRANDFVGLTDDDHAGLVELGLRTVVDLRTETERTGNPDPTFPGTAEVVLDVLEGANSMQVPANLGKVLSDPAVVNQMSAEFSTDKAHELMSATYREFITLDSANHAFGAFYKELLAGELTPVLFHCTTGKDRTGWAAASFLSLMGVARDDVYRDYLLTNDRLLPALAPVFDKFAAVGGDPALLRPLLGVEARYLDAAFAEMEKTHGTLERYFADALGIDSAGQEELRARFLVDA